ncbi:MAG: peptidylprolyl isomerase [Clostridia bacterium]|nr:peptidylprolyl isomerase [Clostridia bacterium]
MSAKKILAVLLTLFVIACVFAGCGDGGTDNTDKKDDTSMMVYEKNYKAIIEKYADKTNPIAVFQMESGASFVAELYPDKAPNTVNNFISLANKGFYDGLIFHRVIDGFMIQGGDPTGTGSGGPGYRITGEFSNNDRYNDLSHTPGVLSMARQGNPYNPKSAYNTAGSQFFICVADCSYSLDGDYAAFGKVIEGLENVLAIAKVETDRYDKPLNDQKMIYVRVDTHGTDYPAPETYPE